MNDLRWDQEKEDERTHYHLKAVTQPAHVLTPAQLRTVPMPDLRSGEAREMDAATRGLDCRTADDKVRAEFVRLVDELQTLKLRMEVLEGAVGHMVRMWNLPPKDW